MNYLCNIALSRIISLSWGAKKKESKNSRNSCLCVGDRVTVANHGNHWQQPAEICRKDYSTKIAIVKWDVTQKRDPVDLGDCKKYDEVDVSQRKCKSTDFYFDMTTKKCKENKKSDALLNPPTGQMKNLFYSEENSSKLCSEGAIGNLMNMPHCSKKDMELFWELATSDLPSIMRSLNESTVPKKLFN